MPSHLDVTRTCDCGDTFTLPREIAGNVFSPTRCRRCRRPQPPTDESLDARAAERAVALIQERGADRARSFVEHQILKLDRDVLPEQRDDDAVLFWSRIHDFIDEYIERRVPVAVQVARARREGVA